MGPVFVSILTFNVQITNEFMVFDFFICSTAAMTVTDFDDISVVTKLLVNYVKVSSLSSNDESEDTDRGC